MLEITTPSETANLHSLQPRRRILNLKNGSGRIFQKAEEKPENTGFQKEETSDPMCDSVSCEAQSSQII